MARAAVIAAEASDHRRFHPASLNDTLPALRWRAGGADADRRVSVLLSVHALRRSAQASSRRLLCVLLLRHGAMSVDAGSTGSARLLKKSPRLADSAGVFGAIFAALCCAGFPLVLGVLASVGLGFIRRDAILLPLMAVSLAIALGAFRDDRRFHRSSGPIVAASAGAAALVAGVLFVHGPPARAVIGLGAVALVAATVWNVTLRRACAGG